MGIFGDEREKKFVSVYHSYVNEVYQYVYMRTGMSKTLAQDITQDIFMDVFRGLSGFKGLCSERTWIFKIARNKLNDLYRKQYSAQFDTIEIDEEEIPTEQQKEIMLNRILMESNAENTSGIDKLKKMIVSYPWRFAFAVSTVQTVVFTMIFGAQYTNMFLSFFGG